MREHPQRKHEVHSHPPRQHPQPPLHRPGLLQHVIDKLKRQVPGELTHMPGAEDTFSDTHRMTGGGRGRLSTQQDL